ncbi:uncharacterized protein LOC117103302, partial [Anneissia japonica]|uniref:uncharacterized protein LOC117103302 n=1 Tax=Anneissia japonica TaxID=1529436 RepID=UPI0014255F11
SIFLFRSSEDDSGDYGNDSTVDPDYIPDKDKISSTELNDDGNSDEEAESGIHPVSNYKELHGKTRDSPNVEINLPAVQKFPNVSDEDQLVDEEVISENEHVDEQENDEGVRPTVRHHKRTGAILTRKRRRDPSSWKCNIRKKLRQSGQEYVNSRGNVQESRSVKTKKDCSKCKFKCSYNIREADRKKVFDEFWTLDDNGKRHFFSRTTTQSSTKRPKVGQPSRRSMSLTYSLPVNGEHIRKCIDSGKTPGKLHLYRQIFNTEFNIGFHMNKKDRCDTCEAMKHNKGASEEEKEAYQRHLTGK